MRSSVVKECLTWIFQEDKMMVSKMDFQEADWISDNDPALLKDLFT